VGIEIVARGDVGLQSPATKDRAPHLAPTIILIVIRIGTSGWNYPSGKGTWNGVFYPSPRPRGFDELAYYAEHFDTVEVNSTFYRSPEPATSAAWVRRTPAGFGFAVKLYQKFTHPEMFIERIGVAEWDVTRGDLDLFRAGIEPLATNDRLVALLVQFPPSFHVDRDTRAYLDWLLGALGDYPLAVELRHRSWSDDTPATQALLDDHRAAWVLIDEPKFESSIAQRLDLTAGTSPLAYVRLHGRNRAAWWEHDASEDRYNYLYSSEELAPFAEAAQEADTRHRRVLFYMNNHFAAKAVANAAILKHQLGELVPGEYSREMVDRYPELADIVQTSGLPL
jgi:uncharacterized protein YecE (DUF72 family)